MACCFATAEEREATRRSREIDRYLEKESKKLLNQLKFLLVGPHGSGKSAFWKQMRILYGEGYSEEDRLQLRSEIYCTILNGMREVIQCVRNFQIPFQYLENQQNHQMFDDWSWHDSVTDVEFAPYVEPLMSLWRDQGVQEAVKRAAGCIPKESFHYFMNNLDTVGQLGYVPSTQDVLHCPADTRVIDHLMVDVGDTVTCLFIDADRVRRAPHVRRVQLLDGLMCILFFVDSNAFDETLPEDGTTNRLKESIILFQQATHSSWFKSTPIFLIHNKIDLLSEKIKEKNIKDYFSNFEGDPHNLDDVQKFLIQIFDAVRPDHTPHYRDLPTSYFMTATDSANVRTVFTKMKDNIRILLLYPEIII